jgi:hypothetical protein
MVLGQLDLRWARGEVIFGDVMSLPFARYRLKFKISFMAVALKLA